MRKAGELAAAAAAGMAAGSQPSTASARPTAKPSKVAATFWLRMTEIYGHRWTSAHGETPTELWSTALSALSGEQIRVGLMACLDSGEPWPPSLPEFVAWCRPKPRENAAAYRCVPMLSAPTTPPDRAHEELARLRAKLKGAA